MVMCIDVTTICACRQVDVESNMGCFRRATFGDLKRGVAEYCAAHRKPGHIDVVHSIKAKPCVVREVGGVRA